MSRRGSVSEHELSASNAEVDGSNEANSCVTVLAAKRKVVILILIVLDAVFNQRHLEILQREFHSRRSVVNKVSVAKGSDVVIRKPFRSSWFFTWRIRSTQIRFVHQMVRS